MMDDIVPPFSKTTSASGPEDTSSLMPSPSLFQPIHSPVSQRGDGDGGTINDGSTACR